MSIYFLKFLMIFEYFGWHRISLRSLWPLQNFSTNFLYEKMLFSKKKYFTNELAIWGYGYSAPPTKKQ